MENEESFWDSMDFFAETEFQLWWLFAFFGFLYLIFVFSAWRKTEKSRKALEKKQKDEKERKVLEKKDPDLVTGKKYKFSHFFNPIKTYKVLMND